MTKLFISGLPKKMDEMQIAMLVAPFGDIDLITLLCDKITGKSKGAAFVHMKTDQGAKDVIVSLDGTTLDNNKLEVRLAGEKPEPAKKPFNTFAKNGSDGLKKRPRITKP